MSEKFKGFEIGLSDEELTKRVHKDYLNTIKMLDVDCEEYTSLQDGDKEALKYLVKAANALDVAFMKQDNDLNLEFKKYLEYRVAQGDETAQKALRLFIAQKGILSVDTEANEYSLKAGEVKTLGKSLYPKDLSVEEFHAILLKMLSENKIDEVKTILNQRSIVYREGDELKAIDYTEAFKEEFTIAADNLEKAADVSTNEDFNEFLRFQAKALRENDPMLDAYADKKWAELQDTPLEFTITRENYEDELTGTVSENEKLLNLLNEKNITALPKDMLGIRVGIINKKGTEMLLEIKKYLPILAKEMPFSDKYEQNISASETANVKQTMVDVDVVTVAGDAGSYRGGIVLAENLPNDDKLSLTIGGGRRNAYHRQIRQFTNPEKLKKRLDSTLAPEFHQYYENEADHWFTIGHENAHSLGPNSGTEALGKYKSIIEENKADMASMAMVDKLVELKMYTEHQKLQIITSFVADGFLKAKPTLSQAHRVRSVMQTKFLMDNGAVEIGKEDGLIHMDFEKVIPTARKMLEEIITIQLSNDFSLAEKFVEKYFIWTDEMELIAQKIKKVSKTLNGEISTPLADKLANE